MIFLNSLSLRVSHAVLIVDSCISMHGCTVRHKGEREEFHTTNTRAQAQTQAHTYNRQWNGKSLASDAA